MAVSECRTSTSTCSGKMRNATWIEPSGPAASSSARKTVSPTSRVPSSVSGDSARHRRTKSLMSGMEDGRAGEHLGEHDDRHDLNRGPRGSVDGLRHRSVSLCAPPSCGAPGLLANVRAARAAGNPEADFGRLRAPFSRASLPRNWSSHKWLSRSGANGRYWPDHSVPRDRTFLSGEVTGPSCRRDVARSSIATVCASPKARCVVEQFRRRIPCRRVNRSCAVCAHGRAHGGELPVCRRGGSLRPAPPAPSSAAAHAAGLSPPGIQPIQQARRWPRDGHWHTD